MSIEPAVERWLQVSLTGQPVAPAISIHGLLLSLHATFFSITVLGAA